MKHTDRNMPPSVAATLAYARDKHSTQRDASGEPYFLHIEGVLAFTNALLALVPPGVMSEVERDRTRRVAILHDTVDDTHITGVTPDDLAREGHEPEVVADVVRLAGRPEGMTYLGNIDSMVEEGNLRVIVAKIGDNRHNILPERIAALPPERRGVSDRYRRSLARLEPAFERLTGVSAHPAPSEGDDLRDGDPAAPPRPGR